jgi:predicted dehydrogenase
MEKIKAGVVGVGHLGQHHARIYAELPEVELVGIYDTDLAKSEAKAKQINTKSFSAMSELISQIEVASLVVPTSFHYEVGKKLLENGVHLLIEKPIAENISQAEELVDLAKRKNLTLQVGHIERFNPAFAVLENFQMEPKFIESHRLAGFQPRGTDVAVILDLMIHDLDLILSLVKSEVESVEAVGISVISENEDIANARITFENGCIANVTASRISAHPMRKMRIFQKNAYFSLDFSEKSTDIYRLIDLGKEVWQTDSDTTIIGKIPLDSAGKTVICEKPEIKKEDMLTLEIKSFLNSVKTGCRPKVTGEDGLKALSLAIEILKKAEKHRQKL